MANIKHITDLLVENGMLIEALYIERLVEIEAAAKSLDEEAMRTLGSLGRGPYWTHPGPEERSIGMGGYWSPGGVMVDAEPLVNLHKALNPSWKAKGE
jgi:hypothetical protein